MGKKDFKIGYTNKLEKEFVKWIEGMYKEHDKMQQKCSSWMMKKDRELLDLEKTAAKFEKEIEKIEKQI
ncbi:hypothetical protein [Aeribacillus sp. FSL M8-0254]|uniref:hypothetical protein n=1 Tax=Aeribacillus sp. FSL M8-0254 TaxID=2954577 RepID=UPI0030FC0183